MATDNVTKQPQARGLLNSLFDRVVGWVLGYPPERCSFTKLAMRIPVSDGLSRIELAADLFQPQFSDSAKPLGTVLVQSPYGRGLFIGIQPRVFAARGYQVLLVSCRGTYGSGGAMDAFRTDVDDGRDVVKWMCDQSWYTGAFATIGGSYLGYVQWALMYDLPKDMVAAAPVVSPQDFARSIWGTGAMNLDIVRWADNVARQEEPKSWWDLFKSKPKFEPVLKTVPMAKNVRTFLGDKAPWLDNVLEKSDISDPYYAPMQLDRALSRVSIPVLIVTGWYDTFFDQSMEQYLRLEARGCNVALTVGPWTHMKTAVNSRANRQPFDWIDQHLGGHSEGKRASAVEYFVTGAQKWINAPTYPPNTTPYTFYLQEYRKLEHKPTSTTTRSASFVFDPQNPTPAFGGNGLLSGGSCNDSALAKRDDVLIFDTAPLEEDIEFCGQPIISIDHSTNIPFADVFVRVSEVNEKGKSRNITEIFQRLDPSRSDNTEVLLALKHRAHRFLRGKRIRVIIAGGNFPVYPPNHGVENRHNMATELRSVEHTVRFDGARPSKIIFPVVDDATRN